MKNFSFAIIILVISLTFSACKKNDAEEGTFTLHFKATYDGLPLSMFAGQPYASNQNIRFSHLSMLISDLALLKGTNREELDDIELVNLSYDNVQDADAGYTLTINNVPADSYTGISFGIGLTPDVNQKKPADFPSSNPLSQTAYYWVAWDSYIFSKVEGSLDTLGNGTFDLGFAFHTGSDAMYRRLEGTLPIVIENSKATALTIAFDYKDMTEGLDIVHYPVNHNPADSLQIQKIVNNLANSVTLIQ